MPNLHLAIVDDNLPLAHALREEFLNFPAFEKITVHGSGLGFVHLMYSEKIIAGKLNMKESILGY